VRSGFHVRSAVLTDWPAISLCFQQAGEKAWSFLPEDALSKLKAPERWNDSIIDRSPEVAVLVLETEGLVLGFSVLGPSRDEDALHGTGEIDAFYIAPRLWGNGAGQELMRQSVDILRSARFDRAALWTEERNVRPRKFYELGGWRESGTRDRDFHGSPLREIRYVREL
jgi:L-amino acid N-acyltransferase YncA